MKITRKTLTWGLAIVVALFVIAFPFGDSKNGLGAHNKFFADLGQTIWVAFLISVPLLLILLIAAAVQHGFRSRRVAQATELADH